MSVAEEQARGPFWEQTINTTRIMSAGLVLAARYRLNGHLATTMLSMAITKGAVEMRSIEAGRGAVMPSLRHARTHLSPFVLNGSGSSALVWVAGNAPKVSRKSDYSQGGKSIPRPLQIVRHAGRGSLELTAHAVLALTKNDWKNDAKADSRRRWLPPSERLSPKPTP